MTADEPTMTPHQKALAAHGAGASEPEVWSPAFRRPGVHRRGALAAAKSAPRRLQCNGGDVTVTQTEGHASITTPNVTVQCHGVLVTRFGYPNDEALAGDPLYSAGLKFYEVVEILDSPWLRDINARNRTRFPNFKGYDHKHYFMAFHDSSLEVLCRSITFDHIETRELA